VYKNAFFARFFRKKTDSAFERIINRCCSRNNTFELPLIKSINIKRKFSRAEILSVKIITLSLNGVVPNPLKFRRNNVFATSFFTTSLSFIPFIHLSKSRDSSVGIATGYGLDDREVGVKSPGRVMNFLFTTSSRPVLRSTQPPVQCVLS
jgi:hypothetical protein